MWTEAKAIGGMETWVCSYSQGGVRFGITLYGTDPEQILEDNCDALPDLVIEGRLIATAEADDDET